VAGKEIKKQRRYVMYIDPNTGGMLFQALVVMFGVISGAILLFSRKIRMFVSRTLRFLREVKEGEKDISQGS
jgi:hypothetical protein